MSDFKYQTLPPVAKTLLIPLACRALEASRLHPLILDPRAVEVFNALGGDESFLLGMGKQDAVAVMMRARQYDAYARDFLKIHPRGLVVDLGCGLDTRFERLDDGQMRWLGVDLPEVIEIRRQVLADGVRHTSLACSLMDERWMENVDASQGVLFLLEGVTPYLTTAELKPVFQKMAWRYNGSQVVMEVMTPFLVKHHNRSSQALKQSGTRIRWDLRDIQELEDWGLRVQSQWGYFDQKEPRIGFWNVIRFVRFIAESNMITRCVLDKNGISASVAI